MSSTIKTFRMKLNQEYFDQLLNGGKKSEAKLNKSQHRLIRPHDIVVFHDEAGNEITTEVKAVKRYENVESMLDEKSRHILPHVENRDEAIKICKTQCGTHDNEELEKKCGYVAFDVKLI